MGQTRTNKAQTISVTHVHEWTWKRRALLLFGIFGGIWVILEPLFAFSGSELPLNRFGPWRYLILLTVSIIITIAYEYFHKIRELKSKDLITFTILSIETGLQFNVQTILDMKTSEFMELFLKRASKYFPEESKIAKYEMYDYYLARKQDDIYIRADPNATLRENNIEAGKEYRISGQIKQTYVVVQTAAAVAEPPLQIRETQVVGQTAAAAAEPSPEESPPQPATASERKTAV